MKRLIKLIIALALAIGLVFANGLYDHNSAVNAKSSRIKSAVSFMVKIANNNKNGYSQGYRAQKNKKGGVEHDCSSLVYTAFRKAGYKVSMGTTYTMPRDFCAAGFKYISSLDIDLDNSKHLKYGDILWIPGHTEVYVGNGKRVGARKNYDKKAGDSSGKEISVKNYGNGGWAGIFRYVGKKQSAPRSYKVYSKMREEKKKAEATAKKTSSKKITATAKKTTKKKVTTKKKTKKTTKKKTAKKKTTKKVTKKKTTKKTTKKKTVTKKKAAPKKKVTSKKKAKKGVTYYKTKEMMWLRKTKKFSKNLIKKVPKGAKVKVTEVSNGWLKATYGGKTGWLLKKNCKKL